MNIIVLDGSLIARLKIEELLVNMGIDNTQIHLFDNGQEALEFYKNHGADLVFSSLQAYELDGISFADLLLRENPKIVSKLFIVSAEENRENYEEIKGVGAKRFIKKPINEEYFNHFIIPEINKVLKHN